MRRARTPNELGFDQHDRQRLAGALRRATEVRTYRRVAGGAPGGPRAPRPRGRTDHRRQAGGHLSTGSRRYLRTHRPDCLARRPPFGPTTCRRPPSPTPGSYASSAVTRSAWATPPPAGRWRCWPSTWAASTAARSRPEPCAAGCGRWACAGSGRATSTPTRTRTGPRKRGAHSPPEADAQQRGPAVPRRDHPPAVPAAAVRLGASGASRSQVRISGRNAKRVLFGVINPRTGHRLVLRRFRMRQEDFQAFLRYLRRHYPGRPLWLLLDRAPCHEAVKSQRLAARLGVVLLWLPKQCSELNAMDQLWKELKRLIAANRQFRDGGRGGRTTPNIGSLGLSPGKPSQSRRACPRTSGSRISCNTFGYLLMPHSARSFGRCVPHEFRQRLEVYAVDDRPRAEGVPQAVQLCVLGDAGRLADRVQPLARREPVPGSLAVVEEDLVAGLLRDGVTKMRSLSTTGWIGMRRGLLVFLAVLCRRSTSSRAARSTSAHSRSRASPGRQPVKRRKTSTWRKRPAGLGRGPPPPVGGADLAAARVPLALRLRFVQTVACRRIAWNSASVIGRRGWPAVFSTPRNGLAGMSRFFAAQLKGRMTILTTWAWSSRCSTSGWSAIHSSTWTGRQSRSLTFRQPWASAKSWR